MNDRAKPPGHVAVPLFLFGVLSVALGVVAEMVGAFRVPTEMLREAWQSGGLEVQAEMGLPGRVGFLITTLASFGLVGAILGTPGTGRRVILGITAFFLSLSLIPTFAVWGIFWKPFGLILAVAWAAFSSVIYASRHQMPCESVEIEEAGNVIRLDGEREEAKSSTRANGKS
jgi:hypothetical protein